ncbi:PIG-L family deacetylase, partial [Pseudomonas gingeri]|nr:PIG-L family deacetylase [Pseudomonas gingeri]
AAKRRAIEAHASQLAADPSTGATAILPPAVLERLLQPFELFFR